METDIRPIDDANLMPQPQQHRMINTHRQNEEEEEDDNESIRQTPIYLPPSPPQHQFHPQQHPRFDTKTQDLFGEIDKTTYIIIFVAFILGFFMGKTMQPVILRPN